MSARSAVAAHHDTTGEGAESSAAPVGLPDAALIERAARLAMALALGSVDDDDDEREAG